MEHLNRETLARLVDEQPGGNEQDHLEACVACREELEALAEQTRALGRLPDLLPPGGEWEALEVRLREEGLLREERPRGARGFGAALGAGWDGVFRGPGWRGIAAALALFIGGAGFGLGVGSIGGMAGTTSDLFEDERSADAARFASQAETVDEAAEGVRHAEEQYVIALERYRQLMEASGEQSYDPISRFAALDALVAASQAAVREAPTDPFLNGMLLSTVSERQATLRRISTSNDNWY